MKLPPTVAETGAFQAHGRQVSNAAGRANSGDDRHGFDDVLSNFGAKPNEVTSSLASNGKPALVGKVTATAIASAQGTQDAGAPKDAPTFLDALLAGSSRATTADPAEARTSNAADAAAQENDPMVDGVSKRLGKRGDDAPAATPAGSAPQDTAAILSLVTPAGMKAIGAQPSPLSESTSTSTPALPRDGSDTVASPASDPTAKAGQQPLIFNVSVASQLAPIIATANASAAKGSPSSPIAGSGDPTVGGAGLKRSALRPSTPVTHSDVETVADPGGSIVGRAVAHAPQQATSPASSGAIAPSSSSSAGPSSQPLIDTDPETPRKDEASSSLDGTSPTPAGMLASATPTLSPPVRQVAAALARLASDASASSGATPGPDASTPRPTLARTLTLQISPATLGTVAVRMHSTGGGLDVQLTASDPQTAGLLTRERGALAASLQDQRTTLHSLVIHDGSGAPQPGGHHATQGDSSGAEAHAHRQGSDAGSDGEGRQRRERSDGQPRRETASDGDPRGPQARPDVDRRSLLV